MKGLSLVIWGMVFGAVGVGFLAYGRKQRAIVPLITGVALIIVPYLVSNTYLLVITGLILVLVPYFVRV